MRITNLSTIIGNKDKFIYESIIRKKIEKFSNVKFMNPKIRTFFMILIFLIMSKPAGATDYFVATSGNDNGSGTLNDPWKNISYAIDHLYEGDTLFLINGTWKNEHIALKRSGTWEKPIQIKKYNGTVILDGVTKTGSCLTARDKSYIKIDGLTIKNYSQAMLWEYQPHDYEFSNFSVYDCNLSGVEFKGYSGCSVYNISIHDFYMKNIGGLSGYTCAGIKHEYTFTDSHDFEIYNFTIEDAPAPGSGIRIKNVNNLSIHDGEIYNMSSGNDGIFLGACVNNSIIENVTVNKTGFHGICLQGGTHPANYSSWVKNTVIKNCKVGYPGHNAIDIHTGNSNITIEDTIIYGLPEGLQGINYMWDADGLNVKNVTIFGLLKGLYLTQPNASLWNCTVYNVSEYCIYVTKPNASINDCNLVSNLDYTILLEGDANNFTINSTRIGVNKNLWVKSGSGTLCDMLDSTYSVTGTNGTNIIIEYTDGKVFTVSDSSSKLLVPLWTPKKSYFIFSPSAETTINVKSYPMIAKPAIEGASITIDNYDTSLLAGNMLINFTVDSTDNNKILFNIGDLKPEHSYIIRKDGTEFALLKADSSGKIEFENSNWPKHTFTVEEHILFPIDIPVADAGNDVETITDYAITFNGSNSTSKNETVFYTWDFDASNGIQSDAIGAIVNHTYETAGVYTVTLTITDANGNTDCDTCTVTVLEESKATKICIFSPNVSLPGKTFTVDILIDPSTPISGTQLDFVFNSSKASVNNVTEGDLLKQNGASTIFSKGTTDNSTGTVKNIYGFILGTSNVSSPGTMATVNLTAGSKTGIAEFSLSNVLISDADSKSVPYTVTNANVLIDTAPVMSTICCPKSVDEKSTLTFKVSAKDADCDRLTLSASGLPEGASFNRTSGNFTWTPAVGQAGVYTLTFEVSDGYLTDSENVTVTVNKLNNSPVINSFKPLNGSSFSEGERIEISVNASDAEGQALNYSIMIDGVACSTGTEYVWETDYSSSGNHTIEVVVSDGTDEVKKLHTIYISECHPRYDVNEDGVVNILDVTSVSQKCGTTVSKPYPRYDVNQDGAVNILDLTLVGNHFGELVK